MKTPTHLFNATATLMRATTSQDRQGGVMVTYTAVSPTFKCRVVTVASSEERAMHGDDVTYSATMFCGFDVTISDKDRITIAGTTYKVSGVNNNQNAAIFQTVELTDSL